MKWPLGTRVPREEIPVYNLYFLHAPHADQADPTLLWGTEIDVSGLQDYLRRRNEDSQVLISTSHVLLRATAVALSMYPELNRRAVGRKIYPFRDTNVRMAYYNPRSQNVDVLLVERADQRDVPEIARIVWRTLLDSTLGRSEMDRDRRRLQRMPEVVFHVLLRLYGWLDRRFTLPTIGRMDGLRRSAVLINDLSFRGAPPMRCYKPTRFLGESAGLNVTLGPMEDKVVLRDGMPAASTMAPLFVRADHRITDAYRLGRFLATLRDLLQAPEKLDPTHRDSDENDGRQAIAA